MRISAKLIKEREATPVVEAPKRKRRTKAEIEADEAAAAALANDSKTEEE